jgi:hypothetical protein
MFIELRLHVKPGTSFEDIMEYAESLKDSMYNDIHQEKADNPIQDVTYEIKAIPEEMGKNSPLASLYQEG